MKLINKEFGIKYLLANRVRLIDFVQWIIKEPYER